MVLYTSFTRIETTPEQDKRMVNILNETTSRSGYIDNCASRVTKALSTLNQDLDFVDRLVTPNGAMFPVEVEINAKRYMRAFGGQRYTLNKVNEHEAKDLKFNEDFKKFDTTELNND